MKKKRKAKKTPFIILLVLICLIFGALYIFKGYFDKNNTNNEDEEEVVEKPSKEYNVSLTLAGNILINSNMWADTRTADGYNFDSTFEYVNDIMKKSDVNFYFQQSILGGKALGSSLYYNYNSPEELLTSLSNVGFNMASLASRHAYDKGINGISKSIELLNDKKIVYSGINDSTSNNSNNIITKNGVKIGLLSYTIDTDEVVNEEYAINIYSDELVKNDVTSLKKNVDLIIVSIDWSNNQSEVTEEQRRIAKYLSDLGVNVVVGNTSYSIQPIEIIDNTIVCYSLGNLLSGHTLVDSRISAMVDFDVNIVKDDTNTKISFGDLNVLLNYAYNSNGANYKVIPFTKMTNELLNYKSYYDKYNELLTKDTNVKLYSIGE